MGEKKGGGYHHDDRLTAIYKVELHCQGCAKKVVKAANSCSGVEIAKADCDKSKLTVVGDVDPVKLRDKLEKKTKKKFALVSPQPKQKEDQKSDKKPDENKAKEKKALVTTTVVLKMHLHCDGCIEKIRHIISKTKGVERISFDRQKDLITIDVVTVDINEMLEDLEKKMKRRVEIVPPKKSDGKDDGKEKKETTQKAPIGDGGKKDVYNPWPVSMPMAWQGYGHVYNIGPAYPSFPVQNVHAPQTFSDENPNACSVM